MSADRADHRSQAPTAGPSITCLSAARAAHHRHGRLLRLRCFSYPVDLSYCAHLHNTFYFDRLLRLSTPDDPQAVGHLPSSSISQLPSRRHLCTRGCGGLLAGGGEHPVMGLAKMAPDGWAYYAAEVAAGGEDYFAGHGDGAGRWEGRGAAALGLGGPVAPEALARLFGEGRHPGSGEDLGHRFPKGGPVPVAGYAISFSPPKSTSVLWALADEATGAAVRGAHDSAVEAALGFLQDHAGFTRRGKAGAAQADTDGYLAAAFTHRTSRAGDLQLHTHVLIANKVRACSDGRWLSLDGRELFEVQKAAGLVYKAGLRAELTARLGVAWAAVDADGGGEIVGVPEVVLAGFSTRRAEVLARSDVLAAERENAVGRSLSGAERAEVLQLAA